MTKVFHSGDKSVCYYCSMFIPDPIFDSLVKPLIFYNIKLYFTLAQNYFRLSFSFNDFNCMNFIFNSNDIYSMNFDQKFQHGLLDSLNPIHIAHPHPDIETTCHYLLLCLSFTNERPILLNVTSIIQKSSVTSCDPTIVKFLLYGDELLE